MVVEAKKKAGAAWRLRGRDGWWLRREKPRPGIVRAGAAACMAVHAELFQGYGLVHIPVMITSQSSAMNTRSRYPQSAAAMAQQLP